MIFRLLLAVAALYALYRFVRYVQGKADDERRSYYISLLIGLTAAGLIALSVTGRVHWLAGIVGGAIPFIRQYILQHVYHRLSGKDKQSSEQAGENSQQQAKTRSSGAMNREQALAVLGLTDQPNEEDIVAAHRKLMQKCHPDRGGNDYLASQLNAAKDFLINDLHS